MWWVLASCGSAPVSEQLPAPTHANGWDDLVAAVERGDVETSRVLARDLSLGGIGEDSPWATRLGGALGLLQVSDAEDLREGLDAAAVACRGCHAEAGVEVPGPRL
jgi:hypothetical protein